MTIQLKEALGHLLIDWLILHKQQRQQLLNRVLVAGMVWFGANWGYGLGDVDLDRKCAALAKLALDAKFATHCGYESFGNGKAKTGATVAPANGVGGLGKWLENKLQLVGRNANACVTHGKQQAEFFPACGAGGHIDGNRTILREFDSVADNIEQY